MTFGMPRGKVSRGREPSPAEGSDQESTPVRSRKNGVRVRAARDDEPSGSRRRSDTSSSEDRKSSTGSVQEIALTDSDPPFTGPNWTAEKLLAKRRSHLPSSSGDAQLEYLTKWIGRSLESSTWMPAELLDPELLDRFRDVLSLSSEPEAISDEEENVDAKNERKDSGDNEKRSARSGSDSPPETALYAKKRLFRKSESPKLRATRAAEKERNERRKPYASKRIVNTPTERVRERENVSSDDSKSTAHSGKKWIAKKTVTRPSHDSSTGSSSAKSRLTDKGRSTDTNGSGNARRPRAKADIQRRSRRRRTSSKESSEDDPEWRPGQSEDENDLKSEKTGGDDDMEDSYSSNKSESRERDPVPASPVKIIRHSKSAPRRRTPTPDSDLMTEDESPQHR